MKSLFETRRNLLFTFLFSLILQILLFYMLAIADIVPYASLANLSTNILKIYSTHLALIFSSFIFSDSRKIKVSSKLYYLSMTVALFWNILLISRTLIFLIDATFLSNRDKLAYVIAFHNEVSELSSFVIVGLIAYFFQSKEEAI